MSQNGRVHNVARNAGYGVLYKLMLTVVPFFMRTVMIYSLGIEYLGLNGLFSSVLQILNLAELGIASAMNFAMYKPIADDDGKKICAILALYKKYYFYIGWVVLGIGLVLVPFLPNLINGEVPSDINVYLLYSFYLIPNVLSYWLFSYRCSLLEAHQRNDIINKINLFLESIKFILQFVVLLVYRNYYAYILIQFLSQIVFQFILNGVVKRTYPAYQAQGELSKKDKAVIAQRVKDIITAKLGGVILNSSDTVIISAFLGLSMLATYQNYYFLISAVIGFIGMAMSGAMASVGNSIVTESREKVYVDFKSVTFMVSWIVCVCTCCFFCLFQPFMKIWVGEELMMNFSMVICLCVYFFLFEFNQLINIYKDAAGLWHEDKLRPLVVSLANLGLNLILIRIIGIYGVVLSTIGSMLCIGMPWLLHNVFQYLFKRSPWEYIRRLVMYAVLTAGCCLLTHTVCNLFEFSKFINLCARLAVAVGLPSMIYWLLFARTKEYGKTMEIAMKILNPILKKVGVR